MTCGAGWLCEHRWPGVARLVGWRRAIGTEPVTRWLEGSGRRVAFGRGDRGFVVINGDRDPWGAVLRTDLPPGRYDNWLATDPGSIVVDEGGVLRVTVPPGQAVVLAIPTIRPRGVEN